VSSNTATTTTTTTKTAAAAGTTATILQLLSTAIEQVAEGAGSSVVSVEGVSTASSCGSGSRKGSGVVWDDQGHIVTAYHVVRGLGGDDDGNVVVEIGTESGQKYTAKLLGHDRRSDLAVLKIVSPPDAKVPSPPLQPIAKGDSEALKVGQFVLALANPYSTKASATSGIITGVKRNNLGGGWWGFNIEDAIVTDARVNPGYSGGPLVDASGKMVGLNVAAVSSRGIAVPVQTISKVFERLAAGKSTGRAYLGIVSNPVPLPEDVPDLAQTQSGQSYGVIVLSVEAGSPAKEAGLALGDVLLGLDGNPVEGLRDLGTLLTEERIGKATKLRVLRGGKVIELSVTPGAAPEREW
jgi:S1-C subfamily serine protease